VRQRAEFTAGRKAEAAARPGKGQQLWLGQQLCCALAAPHARVLGMDPPGATGPRG